MRIAWEHRKAIKTIEVLVAFRVFQCRKRQCYDASDAELANMVYNVFVFQCRKRQCYDARMYVVIEEKTGKVSMPQAAML